MESAEASNGMESKLVTLLATAIRFLLKAGFAVYDLATYIPNKILANPTKVLERANRIKAAPTVHGNPASPWQNIEVFGRTVKHGEVFPGCDTIGKASFVLSATLLSLSQLFYATDFNDYWQVWDECARRYGVFDCYGVRPVLSVQYEKQASGRVFEKMKLGDYHWTSYSEASKQVDAVAKGLLESGQKMKEKVITFSETCAEWSLTALACFKCNFPVTTVYATLGDEAVLYAINECQAATIFVASANLPKLARIIPQCKYLRTIIYYPFRDPEAEHEIPQALQNQGLQIISFEAMMEAGRKSARELHQTVNPNDLAMIMYTSGTTGNPKGVLLTHKNVLSASIGQSRGMHLRSDDVLICYLPQAHIYEVCYEMNALEKGCKVGFSSAQTLLDHAGKLMAGEVSDFRVLKPTVVACVPTIMNRIRKEVDRATRKNPLIFTIYRTFYEWAKSRFVTGYPSFMLENMIFKQVRDITGGRVRLMISGSAPLDPETHLFMTIACGCRVAQGYGLTETCGGATVQVVDDRNTGTVGPPISCCEILLKEWKEGNYFPNNEKPQGEVLIGGDCVSPGYFNNPEKTAEEFVTIDGKRWFCTGDIGEFRADGQLCIIDRKKDLVKLAHGEYISLGKVESILINDPLVDSICVYAGFNQSFLVALVVPNMKPLAELAKKIGVVEVDKKELCKNEKVKRALLADIQLFSKAKLLRVEVPQKIHLCSEAWTPANGLVTEALKLKRKVIENVYKDELDQMYAE